MKHLLEIECPEGYKPVYDAKSGKIKITEEYDYKNIKTFEDACKYLHTEFKSTGNKHADAIIKIDIISKALNNNHQFKLDKESVYHPYIILYLKKPTGDYIKIFTDKLIFVTGGSAYLGSNAGLGCLHSHRSSSDFTVDLGLFPCKSMEIAKHFSKYFVKEIFDAIYSGQLNYEYI